jgi:hypothetical protein
LAGAELPASGVRILSTRAATWELLRDALPVVLATRLVFLGLTLLMPLWRAAMGVAPLTVSHATGTPFDVWNRWDARWYDDLARLGYNLHGPHDYKNVAFFPLFPLLVRTLHDALALVGRDVLGLAPKDPFYPPYLVPGMIVANLCAVAALSFFYGYVRLDRDRVTARRAVTLLALSPPSLYTFAAYSESTFLLCALAFFYALRLKRWWQAGLWGWLAAATRPPGVVLVVPFLMAWAEAHPVATHALGGLLRPTRRALAACLRVRLPVHLPRQERAAAVLALPPQPSLGSTPCRAARGCQTQGVAALWVWQCPGGTMRRAADLARGRAPAAPRVLIGHPPAGSDSARRAALHLLPMALIPLGLGLFMTFLFYVFGDPLWFSRAQQAWWRTFAPPWETLYMSVAWPLGDVLRGTITYWDPIALHDLASAIVGLGVTWLAWQRVPRVEAVYLWLLWGLILSSPAMLPDRLTHEPHHDVLMSLPRMLLMMFPLCTYLAVAVQRRVYPWLAVAFTVSLLVYTGRFLTGGWVA